MSELLLLALALGSAAPYVPDLSIGFLPADTETQADPGGSARVKTRACAGGGFGEIDNPVAYYYLSTDPARDAGDVIVGSARFSDLDPGECDDEGDHIDIPAGQPDGDYYLLAVIDPTNSLPEPNEDNNVAVIRFTVGAGGSGYIEGDFTAAIDGAATSTEGTQNGARIAVAGTVCNIGPGYSPFRTYAAFFLSRDASVSPDDTPIGSDRSFGALAEGDCADVMADVQISRATAPGAYYVLVQADPDGTIPEAVETNNVAAQPFTVLPGPFQGPDFSLTIFEDQSEHAAYPDSTFHVSAYFCNYGYTTTVDTRIGFEIETYADHLPTTTRPLGSYPVVGLAPGECRARYIPVRLPPDIPFERYYINSEIDDEHLVAEPNEANNHDNSVYQFQVGGGRARNDFVIAFDTTATDRYAIPGQPISMRFVVCNVGTGGSNLNSVNVDLFVAADSLGSFPGSVYYFTTQVAGPFPAGACHSTAETEPLRAGVPLGTRYLVTTVNQSYGFSEPERDTRNNRAFVPIEVVLTPPVAGEAGPGAVTALLPPTPNPSRERSVVRYSLAESGPVRLAVVDVLGREVATLAEGVQAAGAHEVSLDAHVLPAGPYVVAMRAGAARFAERLVVVR